MKRRTLGVFTAVTLAAVGTLVLVSYVNAAEDRALAGERTVDVLVVAKPIDKGARATDLASSVESHTVPAKVRADDAVSDLDALGSKVTAVSLMPGEQLIAGRFVDPAGLESVGAVEVPDGLLQVTVGLSPERAVGGQIEPGATVAVLASFDPMAISNDQSVDIDGFNVPGDGNAPHTTHMIHHKILVTNVQRSDTPSGDDAKSQAPNGNLLVTLALPAPAVEDVVFAAEHGSLWLAYEPADAPEDGVRVVTRAVVYR